MDNKIWFKNKKWQEVAKLILMVVYKNNKIAIKNSEFKITMQKELNITSSEMEYLYSFKNSNKQSYFDILINGARDALFNKQKLIKIANKEKISYIRTDKLKNLNIDQESKKIDEFIKEMRTAINDNRIARLNLNEKKGGLFNYQNTITRNRKRHFFTLFAIGATIGGGIITPVLLANRTKTESKTDIGNVSKVEKKIIQEANQEIVKAKNDADKTWSVAKKGFVIYGNKPTEAELDIPTPTNPDLIYTLISATKVNEVGESTVVIKISHKTLKKATKKLATFIVGGFETKPQADARMLHIAKLEATAQIDSLLTPYKDNKSHDESQYDLINNIINGVRNGVNNATNLEQVAAVLANGKIWIINAIDTYNNSKGTDQADVDKVTAQQINEAISKTIVDKTTTLPTQVAMPSKNAININGVVVEFTTWVHNNGLGRIQWTATLTKGLNGTRILSSFSDNFQTTLQKANAAILKEKSNHTGDVSIKKKVRFNETTTAFNFNIMQPTNSDLKYEFQSSTKVNVNGEAIVTIIISSKSVSNATKQLATFIVGGFETKSQADARIFNIAKLEAKAIAENMKMPNKNNKAYDESLYDVIGVEIQKFKNAIDKANTHSTLKSAIVDGEAKVEKAIEIYKNSTGTDQAAVDKITVQQINKEISSYVFDESITIPSDVFKPNKWVISIYGVKVAFTQWVTKDDVGIIEWTASLKKGSYGKKVGFKGTISGFKTV